MIALAPVSDTLNIDDISGYIAIVFGDKCFSDALLSG